MARIQVTPELEHHVAWDGGDGREFLKDRSNSSRLPKGFISRIRFIRAETKRLSPDLVHAHSSWAGVYVRLAMLGTPVVYEPHCFKFDDPNTRQLLRRIYRGAEWLLARRTAGFGTLSEHEAKLVKGLGPDLQIVHIPNVPTVGPRSGGAPLSTDNRQFSRVVMVGRICRQKDPKFFVRVVKELRTLGSMLEPVWIGDGDSDLKQYLLQNNIVVTGWVDASALVQALDGAIYCHSASYEGFPLSVLDAAQVGAPIVARSIPALDGTPITSRETPKAIAFEIASLSASSARQEEAQRANVSLLSTYNVETLRRQLLALYAKAYEVTG